MGGPDGAETGFRSMIHEMLQHIFVDRLGILIAHHDVEDLNILGPDEGTLIIRQKGRRQIVQTDR